MSGLTYQLTPYTVPILLAGSITFTCGILLWRGGSFRSRFAGLLLFDLSLWMFGYAMELTVTELAPKILAQNIQFGAGAFISVTWFAFITTYSGHGRWMRTEVLVPLSIPPLATIALLATNRYHQLIAHDYMLDVSGSFVVLVRSWGPWYYFTIAYTYLLLLIGTLVLFRIFLRSNPPQRRQTGLLIIGIIFPWIGSFLDMLEVNAKLLYGFDFTPFGFLLTGLVITWNILYYQFGNIIPISYETAIDNMSDGMLVADPAGRIVSSNTAAREIFQHVGKSLNACSLQELIPDLSAMEGPIPKHAGTAEEETVLRIPENRRTYGLRRSWVSKQKQPISQILVLRDMSERFQAEQDLLEAKSLAEEANRAKSEFLANMSHELRTPLHHIIGFTELIANRQFGDLTETQVEYLQDVLDSARNLLELINDIVEITKIDTGMLEVRKEPAYLQEILEGTLAMLREKALKHGITIKLNTGNLPETILLDVRKIKQSLFNVASKAVALTPDGGQVDLDVHIVHRRRSEPASMEIRITCFDVSFSQEDLEGIFKPFEQVKSSTDHPYLARGSGLALAKRLVELQGGRIRAESGKNHRGIAFVLELPVSTEHARSGDSVAGETG
jgi:signal transduction histidine kinase